MCLIPSQEVLFLGITLDSIQMLAFPSLWWVVAILQILLHFWEDRSVRYNLFLRLLGMLTSVTSIVPLGLLHLRPFQVWTNGLHLDPRLHGSRKIRVSRAYLAKGVTLGHLTPQCGCDQCFALWLGVSVAAQGSERVLECAAHNINVLKLCAIYLALCEFLPYLWGRHVLVRCDKSSVYNVNHQGGTRSLQAAQQLLVWALPYFSSLWAMYLPGPQNTVAAFLSHQSERSLQWSGDSTQR